MIQHSAEDFFLPTVEDGEDKSRPLKNRIRKNYKHLRKWAKRNLTNSFRIYDRDIKEYPLAIDFYDGKFCVHYFCSKEEEEKLASLSSEVEEILFSLFGASKNEIFERTRFKRKKMEQYEKLALEKNFFIVREYGAFFRVNLEDYLDTGLFLDHRETRKLVAAEAKGKDLLNLFAYTCAFSVQAALHGASFTKSVDLSNTYCAWGEENFTLNAISPKNHKIVRADCLVFLQEEERSGKLYDIIVIDPPTLSRSKKMVQFFDIQKDHSSLLLNALPLLRKGGKIFFSTNARTFRLDTDALEGCNIKEITHKTLPIDFHDKKIHRCWEITRC